MELYVDSANVDEIRKWREMGVVDGVTTNPSIMLSDGVYDMEKGAKAIAALALLVVVVGAVDQVFHGSP